MTCKHGNLARQCELCEKDRYIDDLERRNAELVEAMHSIHNVLLEATDDDDHDDLCQTISTAFDVCDKALSTAPNPEPNPQDIAFNDLRTAVEKAQAKHPPMRGAHEGYAVILEEVDELWEEVKRQVIDGSALRKEALHVAAMGLRFVIDVCPIHITEGPGKETT